VISDDLEWPLGLVDNCDYNILPQQQLSIRYVYRPTQINEVVNVRWHGPQMTSNKKIRSEESSACLCCDKGKNEQVQLNSTSAKIVTTCKNEMKIW